jgi:transcription initiation factor IIF auxiliary subunit
MSGESRISKIRFSNYSMMIEKKHDDEWWEWCIFIDEDDYVVRKLKQVEYTLHPTFPDPIRTVADITHRFALYSSGWGQFTANIEVLLNDNSTINQSHFIAFSPGAWPVKEEPLEFDTPNEKAIYYALKDKKYRWRKTNTILKTTNLPHKIVLEILENLEVKELVRKSPFKAIDKSDMWGITAIVGCYPPRVAADEVK